MNTAASTGRPRANQDVRPTCNIRPVEEEWPEMGFEGIRVVDGLGLSANPFEKKLKKKRANVRR